MNLSQTFKDLSCPILQSYSIIEWKMCIEKLNLIENSEIMLNSFQLVI